MTKMFVENKNPLVTVSYLNLKHPLLVVGAQLTSLKIMLMRPVLFYYIDKLTHLSTISSLW